MTTKRRAESFEVRVTTDGMIEIVQERFDGSGEEDIVVLNPVQIDSLVGWLREAVELAEE